MRLESDVNFGSQTLTTVLFLIFLLLRIFCHQAQYGIKANTINVCNLASFNLYQDGTQALRVQYA